MTAPQVTVIIPSYNTRDITLQTLQSLDRALSRDALRNQVEVIVVDNASADRSAQAIAVFVPSNFTLQLLENPTNEGYGKANNQALHVAKGDYVLYLNSDMLVDSLSLSQLVTYMRDHADIGALTVQVNLESSDIDPASHRGFPTVWRSLCYFGKIEKMASYLPKNKAWRGLKNAFGGYHLLGEDFDEIHDIDSCTGAFMLCPRAVLLQLGGFDEQFFMYGEDLDLCYRIKEHGKRVVWYPIQNVTHLKHKSGLGASNSMTQKQIKWHFYDAMEIFYKKHYIKSYPKFINKLMLGIINKYKARYI